MKDGAALNEGDGDGVGLEVAEPTFSAAPQSKAPDTVTRAAPVMGRVLVQKAVTRQCIFSSVLQTGSLKTEGMQ